MNKIYSYHIHTTYSDGQSTIEEYIQKATNLNFGTIGFSDHLVISPYFSEVNWGMNLNNLENYIREISYYKHNLQNYGKNQCNSQNKLDICVGLEADYFDHEFTIRKLSKIFNDFKFDFLLGSMHFIDEVPIELPPESWSNLSVSRIEELLIRYWQNIVKLAESKLFDVVAHLDYPKQFIPNINLNLDKYIENALEAIKTNNLVLEVNTKGLDSTKKEIYPSFDILLKAYKLNIPIMINPDAHNTSQLTRNFEYAYNLVKQIGYSQITIIKNRIKIFVNINEIFTQK